ncbi:hypothetical protein GWK47_004826 [Chionoecetes opilio]|uniref:Uncharacterized protein n=1 Tax=Chionoecetes opilio TaxID=41210 RepID=A0A8J4YM36_CHIOP|nr:hypothetical protein GWK47_004826 [Chionoecetes opilio]
MKTSRSSSPLPYGVRPSHVVFLPPSYLSLLDKVQARAQRLIRLKALQDQLLPPLQPLQQRRDVAGLCVVYKTHKQHVPHLAALRQPWARPHGHTTRTAATRDHQMMSLYQDGDLSAFPFPSALHKNVEPNGTADTASLYRHSRPSECCKTLG